MEFVWINIIYENFGYVKFPKELQATKLTKNQSFIQSINPSYKITWYYLINDDDLYIN